MYGSNKQCIRVLVDVGIPAPESKPPQVPRVPLEDKVRSCLDMIESGRDSYVQWLTINKFYSKLKKLKPNQRVQGLIRMIEPVLEKYGYYQVSATE